MGCPVSAGGLHILYNLMDVAGTVLYNSDGCCEHASISITVGNNSQTFKAKVCS